MVLKYYNMQSDGNAKESTAKVAGLVLPKDLNNGNNEQCTTQQTDFQMVVVSDPIALEHSYMAKKDGLFK